MERSLFLYIVCSVLVGAESISECELWCRKPMSFEYVCCDQGNPFVNSTDADTIAITSQNLSDILSTTTTTEASLATQPMPTAQPCRYYCVYGNRVYCCDDGSNPVPDDHDTHDGRCPSKKEQVCKKGGIFLHVYAAKMTNKDGGKLLSEKGSAEHHPTCASDGYCNEDEKCCENICAKKHTCMQAVYDYGGSKRPTTPKKKPTKRMQ